MPTDDVISLARELADWKPDRIGLTALGKNQVNDQITVFFKRFRKATPEQRTLARRIIREHGSKPIWRMLETWNPETSDFSAHVRQRLLQLSITWGMTDPRDDSVGIADLQRETFANQLDWYEFYVEYQELSSDFVPGLIASPRATLGEAQARRQIEKLTADIVKSTASAALYYQRGLVYMAVLDFRPALLDFMRAYHIDIFLKNAEYCYQLGRTHACVGHLGLALSHYSQAFEYDPHHPQAAEIRQKIAEWTLLKAQFTYD